jgi:peptide/nickel transport system substrate-binding protein
MRRLRWQIVIILLTGMVVGIMLLGQQQQQKQQQVQEQVIAGSVTPTPKTGGSYTEALVGSFKRYNPLLDLYNSADHDVDRLLFSSLVRFDSRGVPQADLAESWGISQDGTQYNFSLRPNLTWHDGQPLTSDDVIFTIGLLTTDHPLVPADIRDFWKDVQVKRLSETQMQFLLPEPFAPFLDYLSFGILPQHVLGNTSFEKMVDAPFNLKPIGSGPYRFDHLLVENEQIVGVELAAFDGYYLKKPFIEKIIFRYYPDARAALQAYEEGQVQGLDRIPQNTLSDVLAQPDLATYSSRLPRMALIYLNLNNPDVPFLNDPNLRRALLLALNRQWIIDQVYHGQAVQANGPILPGTWAYYDGIEKIPFDLDQAKKVLKKAGFAVQADGGKLATKDGKVVTFQLLYPDDPTHKAVAEAVQRNWSALGITVDLEPKPFDQLISERLEPRVYQAALIDVNLSRSPDPDPYPFWDQAQAASGQNYSQWDNRTAGEYLEQGRVLIDPVERARLYRNFQVIFTKEMPALPLFYPIYTYAVSRQIQGIQMGPLFDESDRFSNVANWSLASGRVVGNVDKTPVPTKKP